MIMRWPKRSGYSQAETVSDAVVHAVGLTAAVLAVPMLIIRTWTLDGHADAIAGVSIYGAALIGMILCSALYNMAHPESWSQMLRRLDHSAIYMKIAGTYTVFALLSPAPAGWFLLWIWTCALLGTGLRSFAPHRWPGVAIGLYLVMGWSGAFAGGALFDEMSPQVFALILSGGLLYTAGFVFHLWSRLPFHRTIWHVFVIGASAIFFAAVAAHLPGASDPSLPS